MMAMALKSVLELIFLRGRAVMFWMMEVVYLCICICICMCIDIDIDITTARKKKVAVSFEAADEIGKIDFDFLKRVA